MTLFRYPAVLTARAGRPRNTSIDVAVLDATDAVLGDSGYSRFTLEEVARRAGTTKPAIRRRWPKRQHLVLAVLAWRRLGAPYGLFCAGALALPLAFPSEPLPRRAPLPLLGPDVIRRLELLRIGQRPSPVAQLDVALWSSYALRGSSVVPS